MVPLAAVAEPCPGNSQALGTERVLEVDAKSTPRIGRKHFPNTLPMAHKELVLTFDDGPWPGTTPKVLDALKRECVRATFFLLGRNTVAQPALARRCQELGRRVPVAVALGGDPACIYAASAPMPDGVDEYLLAGFLRRRPVRLVPARTVVSASSSPPRTDSTTAGSSATTATMRSLAPAARISAPSTPISASRRLFWSLAISTAVCRTPSMRERRWLTPIRKTESK